MYTVNAKLAKKMLPMLILEILKENTDIDHTLSQKEIREKLSRDYGMDVDRKSVKRNIDNLIELGFDICYDEIVRMNPDPKTGVPENNSMRSNLWLRHDFEDSELQLLIDAMMFSNHIPKQQRKDLINKIAGLSSRHFQSHVKHISSTAQYLPQSPQLFYVIGMLDEAIRKKRKIKFHYMEYGADKKFHPRTRPDGSIREYVCSPYQMVASEGKYFLICNYDKYDDISNYRIDRMADVEILDEKIKPFSKLEGSEKADLDLNKYMEEHFYMYAGKTANVKLRVSKSFLGDVIDLFGLNVKVSKQDEDSYIVDVRANEEAMFQFAKGWGPEVIVLKPARLVKRLANEISRIADAYEGIDK